MARPRQFDEEKALDGAMRAFWAAGYEATSTEDLCEATGLGRSSVYNAFNSKRELFERALRRYTEAKTAPIMELLEGDLPVREKVRALLAQPADPPEDDPVGCLVVNSMVELAPRDPEIAEILRRDQDRRQAALRAALDTGRRNGELAPDADVAALADYIAAVIGGMRVAARGGADRATLRRIADTALAAL
ncbi:TetR/AcrR family transcriptional regulator [Bailinhaonella thermotolerans]|uniref:TetR/AcrR family transcriptional regulator n=1 Tax=Bailinhaonella thermotolerans TaxID=1070861 RepID=A0A3A4A6F7_9ACTN|nr:TetR/AcrR family transcriptional regulator [Bailinhaonella thermotolerans]RJL24155.1 TetR/AcrR family transcriptional regulator [Bailinhaonella thermotolerans]